MNNIESAADVMRNERSYRPSFRYLLKQSAEQGLLIFIKYALVLILSFVALQFMTNVVNGSSNGTNAVLYLKELQDKGYLPKVENGTIPPNKQVEPNASLIK